MIFGAAAEEFYTKMEEMPSPRIIKVYSDGLFSNSSHIYDNADPLSIGAIASETVGHLQGDIRLQKCEGMRWSSGIW